MPASPAKKKMAFVEQGAAGSLAFSYAGLGVYGNFFPNNRTGTFSCGPLFVCFDD